MGKWETVRLGDVCSLITDGTHQTPEYCNAQDGYPFLSSKDVKTEVINWDDIRCVPGWLHEQLYKRLAPQINDVLLAKNGTTGVAALVDRDCVFDIYVSLALLRPKENIYPQYLLKVINSPLARNQFSSHIKGIGVPNLHLSEIKNTKIPLPPLDVQHKIADVLGKASALIELRKAQLEKLDLLIKSQFIEMFGDLRINNMSWDMYPFSYVGTIDTHMTNDFELYADVPHIGIENIEKGTGRILSYTLVKDSNLKSGKYPFDERHLIYSKIRPNLNKVAKPNFKGVCSADAYPILPTENSNRDYLSLVLRSEFFLEYILAFSGRTNIPKVNKRQLEGFCLPVPPVSLQNEFAAFVERVETQKKLLQQSLEKLGLNYKSLMQKCFRGEIF